MNESLLNKISLRMQEINEELDKLSKQRAELKQEQANLIAQWARETK